MLPFELGIEDDVVGDGVGRQQHHAADVGAALPLTAGGRILRRAEQHLAIGADRETGHRRIHDAEDRLVPRFVGGLVPVDGLGGLVGLVGLGELVGRRRLASGWRLARRLRFARGRGLGGGGVACRSGSVKVAHRARLASRLAFCGSFHRRLRS